mmetsp:Transcript_4237/g.7841  ORF Transcript_4237/g.7841 Transcript_4237/m.7841 type:complete len:264 (-) Transcript_4237:799-1590(-)
MSEMCWRAPSSSAVSAWLLPSFFISCTRASRFSLHRSSCPMFSRRLVFCCCRFRQSSPRCLSSSRSFRFSLSIESGRVSLSFSPLQSLGAVVRWRLRIGPRGRCALRVAPPSMLPLDTPARASPVSPSEPRPLVWWPRLASDPSASDASGVGSLSCCSSAPMPMTSSSMPMPPSIGALLTRATLVRALPPPHLTVCEGDFKDTVEDLEEVYSSRPPPLHVHPFSPTEMSVEASLLLASMISTSTRAGQSPKNSKSYLITVDRY